MKIKNKTLQEVIEISKQNPKIIYQTKDGTIVNNETPFKPKKGFRTLTSFFVFLTHIYTNIKLSFKK